jgi:tRNA A-37 threonylcarbamoyl transferase component Bud32
MNNTSQIQIESQDSGRLQVNVAFAELLRCNKIESAQDLWELQSDIVKNAVKTRGTGRALLKNPNAGPDIEVYIKRYLKLSLRDRIKCAASFKPVFSDGALHEWRALCRFHELGLKTMLPVAAADCGQRRTCNLTLGITDYIRASDLFADTSFTHPERRHKIITAIAELLGKMHATGLAHQDFYLVHLFIKPEENDAVYLIDLQRTIMLEKLPRRWKIKDLAQIHFALSPFINKDEKILFRSAYQKYSPVSHENKKLWKAVENKAQRIREHTQKRAL